MSMRGIVTVTMPAVSRSLVTLDRVKAELELTGTTSDALLGYKIAEVSAAIESHCNRVFALETVSESFLGDSYGCSNWDRGFYPGWAGGGFGHNASSDRQNVSLKLSRYPVASITSATVDGTALDPSEWLLDAESGRLYRMDTGGFRTIWWSSISTVVVYTAGYVLPDGTPTGSQQALPADLQRAAIELIKGSWFSRKRDPMERSHGEPGLGQTSWGYGTGTSGMPADVYERLEQYRELVF